MRCKARTPIGVREFGLEDDTTPEQASSIILKDDARQWPVIGAKSMIGMLEHETDETAKQIVSLCFSASLADFVKLLAWGELPILDEKTDRRRKPRHLLHIRMLGNRFHRSSL
ncbi:hypothetical protein X731_30590 [Mesorhizobium sp. L2C054A000]|nr:hypothetical protein X731_30590 [Mesorhizobium sp. L2C054A000]